MALTLDGRPISRKPVIALLHDGVLFADAVDLTRVFDGLLAFEKDGMRTTIHGHVYAFHVGVRVAQVDRDHVRLPGAPFEYGGDMYVPLRTILKADGGLRLTWAAPRHADLHVIVFPKS